MSETHQQSYQCRHSTIQIHYHPILLISGIVLGVTYDSWGLLGEATHLVSKAQPRGILAIFLPCLIFQSAFKTEWHVFKKLASQSLILGVLGSLMNACLVMIFVKTFLDPYGVSLLQNLELQMV